MKIHPKYLQYNMNWNMQTYINNTLPNLGAPTDFRNFRGGGSGPHVTPLGSASDQF